MEEVKRLDIKKFRELGFLQEVNRQFLHPRGLALEVVIDPENGDESLGGIWDYREDPEGIHYAFNEPKFTNEARLKESKMKADNVEEWFKRLSRTRYEKLGFIVEPIPYNTEELWLNLY